MRIESNVGADEQQVAMHELLRRVVTKRMMREATGSQWIDETPTPILRHLLPPTRKGVWADHRLYAEVRAALIEATKTGRPYSPKFLDKSVKFGAGPVEFLQKLGFPIRPCTASAVNHQCVFLLMRAFAARNVSWQRAADIRSVMVKLSAGINSRKMSREIEVDFLTSFGFSPCNEKPRKLNMKRLFWLGDPREIAGYLKQVVLRCTFEEFLTISLLSNSFKLSLRAAAFAKLTAGDTEIHISGTDAEGQNVFALIPVQTTLQGWAIKTIRKLHGVGDSEVVLFPDAKLASKIVLGLEGAFEKVGFLPADTDYVLPILPEAEFREYVDRYFQTRDKQ